MGRLVVMVLGGAGRGALVWLGALAAAGIVGCSLIGNFGELPFPPGEGGTGDEVGPDGGPADGADVTVGPDAPGGDSPIDVISPGQCEGGLTACGTACVDTLKDPSNCGRCGHGCQGGTCASGHCQPVTLTPDGGVFGTPKGIAVHGNAVYWVNNGSDGMILSVPVDGGPFTSVVPYQTDAGIAVELAVNDTTVYFTVGSYVLSSSLDGGAVATVASGLGMASGITINGTAVYFTDYSNPGGVFSAPLGGGTITTIAPAEENPGDIALSSTTAYWTASGAGTIDMATLDGGAPMTLVQTVSPVGIATDATNVYWVTGTAVFSIPLGGGTQKTLSPSENNAQGIAVDGSGVYWADYGTSGAADGTVKMIPLNGGPQVTLAASQANPHFIAVDSVSVYWTEDYFSGAVKKVAKP